MPFREWATSLKSSRRSSLDPSLRRTSETSLSILDINDSERTLVGTLDVQDLRCSSTPSHQQQPRVGGQSKEGGCIERRVDYFVVEDDRYAVRFGNYTGVWAGNVGGSVPQTRSRYFGDHIHQHAYTTNKV